MISVTRVKKSEHTFDVRLTGDKQPYFANSLAEVTVAIRHYFMARHVPKNCPICRGIEVEELSNKPSTSNSRSVSWPN
jgi:hypothetical protein